MYILRLLIYFDCDLDSFKETLICMKNNYILLFGDQFMKYKISMRGRVVHNIADLERRLYEVIFDSMIRRKNGEIHLDFYKLNMFLDDDLRKYVKKIMPMKQSQGLGGFDINNKIIYLPYVYSPTTFNSLIHEFVHSIHMESLPNLKFDDSELMSGVFGSDLKSSYKIYYVNELMKFITNLIDKNYNLKKDYNIFLKKYQFNSLRESYTNFFNTDEGKKYLNLIDEFVPKLNEEKWNVAKKITKNVKPNVDLYYATNEEMLAFFENAVQFFSVENMKNVMDKFYKEDTQGFINFLNAAISSIKFVKVRGNWQIEELPPLMRDLCHKIKIASKDPELGGIDKIVSYKWWNQLLKHIKQNITILEHEIYN